MTAIIQLILVSSGVYIAAYTAAELAGAERRTPVASVAAAIAAAATAIIIATT